MFFSSFISFSEVARVDSSLLWQVSCQISRGKLDEDPPRNLVIKTIWVPPQNLCYQNNPPTALMVMLQEIL